MERRVTHEIGLLAKTHGFNYHCDAYCYLSHTGDNYIEHVIGELTLNGRRDFFMNFVGVGITNDDLINNKVGRLGKSFALPTLSELQKWFRDKHNIHVLAYPIQCMRGDEEIECESFDYTFKIIIRGITQIISNGHLQYKTYEDALDAGLEYTLKTYKL